MASTFFVKYKEMISAESHQRDDRQRELKWRKGQRSGGSLGRVEDNSVRLISK